MKSKFLAAAASIAFIAAGVAAHAQDTQKHEQRPAAQSAEPKAGGASAQAEPRHEEMKGGAQGAAPAAHAEGERKEMKGGEAPRAAEAPTQERRAEPTRTGAKEEERNAPRTGAKEEDRNAPRTGAKEEDRNAPRTGAKEEDRNAPRTGAKEEDRNAPRTGAKEEDRNAPRTGANERDRNGARTAERGEAHGQARVQGNVKMSSEHATRVSETLRRVGRPEHVDIDLRVGVRVPETVTVRPLPEDVIAIVPEYRGYDYFIDENDEIVFVAPQTHEVVGMIDYEGRAASDDANYTRVGASRPCPTEN
jgi:hypothetical protein